MNKFFSILLYFPILNQKGVQDDTDDYESRPITNHFLFGGSALSKFLLFLSIFPF